jgi:hypothetical protein
MTHIKSEHNVYQMLFYLIYIDRQHRNDCDPLETLVKEKLATKDIRFVPIQKAIGINDIDEDNS